MTLDTCTWHMTPNMWHMVEVNILSKFLLSSSHSLGVMMFWRFGGKGSLTHFMSNGGVCRTAPATPGLLKTFKQNETKTFLFCEKPSGTFVTGRFSNLKKNCRSTNTANQFYQQNFLKAKRIIERKHSFWKYMFFYWCIVIIILFCTKKK